MPRVKGAPAGGGSLANPVAPSKASRGPSGGNVAGVGGLTVPGGKLRALPGGTGISTPNADAFGAGIGRELRKTGTSVGDYAIQMQNRQNETEAREADADLSDKLRQLDSDYQQLKGRKAYEGFDAYQKGVEDAIRTSGESTTNPVARGIYDVQAQRRRGSSLGAGKKYQMQQFEKWEISGIQGSLIRNTDDLKNTYQELPDPANRPKNTTYPQEGAETRIRANEQDLGDKLGHHQSAIDARIAKRLSDAKVAAIESRLESDPLGAEALYKYTAKTGGFLNEKVRESTFKKVKAHADKAEVLQAAPTLLAEFGGNESEIAAHVSNVYQDEPDIATGIMRQVRFLKDIAKNQREQAEDDTARGVHTGIVQGQIKSLEDIPPPSELGSTRYNQMTNALEYKLKGQPLYSDPERKHEYERAIKENPGNLMGKDPLGEPGLSDGDRQKYQGSKDRLRKGRTEAEVRRDPPSTLTVVDYVDKFNKTRRATGEQNNKRNGLIAEEIEGAFAIAVDQKRRATGNPKAALTLDEQNGVYSKFQYDIIRDGWVDFFDDPGYLWDMEVENPATGKNYQVLELYQAARELNRRGVKLPTDTQIERLLTGE